MIEFDNAVYHAVLHAKHGLILRHMQSMGVTRMAKVKRKIGTGITEYEVTSYSGPDMKSAIEAMGNSRSEKWDKGGGDYGAVSWDGIELARNILKHSGVEPFDRDSAADFSKRIVKLHEIAVAAIKRSDADMAARYAYNVGVLVAEATMKFRWEAHALRGLETKKGGTKARRKRAENYRVRNQEWQSLTSQFWKEKPHRTKQKVAELTKAQLGLSVTWGQIARIIKRPDFD